MNADVNADVVGGVRVKICGVTRPEDALAVEQAGADAIGLIFAERSRRRLDLASAERVCAPLGPFIVRVGVFVDAPLETVRAAVRRLRLGAVQLHGSEDAAYAARLREDVRVLRAVAFSPGLTPASLADYPADAILLDAPQPGSGIAFDWNQASAWRGHPRFILAGGLTPSSVASGVASLRPYAVDVSSGVESTPGIKDAHKVRSFVSAARHAG